jgi:hypothetical protein
VVVHRVALVATPPRDSTGSTLQPASPVLRATRAANTCGGIGRPSTLTTTERGTLIRVVPDAVRPLARCGAA